ncbi:hypothetical protein [Brachybacterium tyrofermentans]|uniref:Uncharacterized protein n=1 Tax=Brachybacterium tyrofermentans TaxID=47848 RepID=A0ABW0FC33_9MICO
MGFLFSVSTVTTGIDAWRADLGPFAVPARRFSAGAEPILQTATDNVLLRISN